MKYKGVMLVSPRDFCSATHWRVEEDGTLYVVALSVPSYDKCPEIKGVVRAHLEIGGWVVRPKPGAAALRAKYGAEIAAGTRPPPHADPAIDAEGCDCTYLMRSDFKGSIVRRCAARASRCRPARCCTLPLSSSLCPLPPAHRARSQPRSRR
jgi:hypothetical protein